MSALPLSSARPSAPSAAPSASVAPDASASVELGPPPSASAVEPPPGELPLICEAYFAKMLECMDSTMGGQPEATRAEVRRRYAEANETSKRQMRAMMTAKEAEAYCRQSLLALTASTCAPPSISPPRR